MSQIEGDCPDDKVGMGDCVAANANKLCYDANGVMEKPMVMLLGMRMLQRLLIMLMLLV